MAIGTDLGIIGTGLAAGGFFLGLGFKADDLISEQAREDLAEYLRSFKPHKTIKTVNLWPRIFRELFDRIFGGKHLSFKCFFRSAIASVLAFCISLTVMYLLLQNSLAEGEVVMLFGGYVYDVSEDDYYNLGFYIGVGSGLLVLGALANVAVDYLSLLETRYIIGRIEQTESAIRQSGWVIFDFVATGLMFFLYMYFIWNIVRLIFDVPVTFQDFIEHFYYTAITLPIENEPRSILRASFWTTYLTSLWVWLYFLAQLLTRFVAPLSKSVYILKYLLPINSYPLRAVCTVMAIIACVGTWIILFPSQLFA